MYLFLAVAGAWGGKAFVDDAKRAGLPVAKAAGGALGLVMIAAGGAALPAS